ncbi:MAG: hypothetical protein LBR26_04055 [Prevotella sp.]|jgi:hypothetical protein|nr:hypothetical protein [Prevotella sp.]
MDTRAKARKIFEEGAEKFIKLQASINGETNSHDFEQSFQEALKVFGHDLYQEMQGGEKVAKNERMQLFTSVGGSHIEQVPSVSRLSGRLQYKPLPSGTDVQSGDKNDL